MAKKKINVQGQEISLIDVNGQDYFSLTDMAKKFGPIPSDFIKGWLRNKDTIEYLGAWEQLYNKSFKRGEFTPFKDQAGTNRFRPSVKDWIKCTAAIGIQSKSGRFGGTYAHKDIAFHFGMWLSPVFQLFVVKEFDRLKETEAQRLNKPWNLRRELAKINYSIHTEAIRESLPLMIQRTKKESGYFANEADMLNEIVFGLTAKQWRTTNPNLDGNLRDHATSEQLHLLANLEALNAEYLDLTFSLDERRIRLYRAAERHMSIIESKKRLE